jgi:glycosyltransferase involved in cell wall biosynthesis
MRVLFLQGRLSERGGADRWLLSTAAALVPHVEVHVGVGRVDPQLPVAELERMGRVHSCKGLGRGGLSAKGSAGAVARLDALIAQVEPDLIHVNDVVDPVLLGRVADTGRGVAMVQDHRAFCPGPGKVMPDGSACATPMGDVCAACLPDADYRAAMLRLTEARAKSLGRMRAVTVLSPYMAEELALLGVPGAHVIPPFVDLVSPPERASPTHHLFAGRLVAAKGVRTVLAAAGQVDLPVVVAGSGPLEGEISAHAHVRFVGWQGRQGMAELLAGAKSLWMPSHWAEPFGIIGLEAMAAGVPVLATDVGGVSSWHPGPFVPVGDAPALAAAARAVVAPPPLPPRFGRGAVVASLRQLYTTLT